MAGAVDTDDERPEVRISDRWGQGLGEAGDEDTAGQGDDHQEPRHGAGHSGGRGGYWDGRDGLFLDDRGEALQVVVDGEVEDGERYGGQEEAVLD